MAFNDTSPDWNLKNHSRCISVMFPKLLAVSWPISGTHCIRIPRHFVINWPRVFQRKSYIWIFPSLHLIPLHTGSLFWLTTISYLFLLFRFTYSRSPPILRREEKKASCQIKDRQQWTYLNDSQGQSSAYGADTSEEERHSYLESSAPPLLWLDDTFVDGGDSSNASHAVQRPRSGRRRRRRTRLFIPGRALWRHDNGTRNWDGRYDALCHRAQRNVHVWVQHDTPIRTNTIISW